MKLDTKQLKNISILYVEDDDIVRIQTEKVLQKLFKKVYVAMDGETGLQSFKENIKEIDIVITDINMPKMTGLDMLKEISKLSKDVPGIVTTAHSDSVNLLKAIDMNVDKYLTKPIQIKELTVSAVELVLKYRRNSDIKSLAKTLMSKNNQNDKENSALNTEVELLKSKNEYLNSIVDNMVINFKIDKNGNITKISNKFQLFFGHMGIVGENISVLRCDSCEQETFQKLMLKAIHQKQTVNARYTLIKNDDSKVYTSITMAPFYGKDALVNGYSVYVDIL
jgi:CheY-like chemotaxis protein